MVQERATPATPRMRPRAEKTKVNRASKQGGRPGQNAADTISFF
jgi:hypothetical protein